MQTHRSFKLSQQAVIFNQNDEFLILKSKNDLWLLPGGRVDDGETNLENALKREIQEETNLELDTIIKPIWFDTSPNISTYAIAFLCTVKTLENFKISSEHSEFKWITKNEAEEYLFYKSIARKIKEL